MLELYFKGVGIYNNEQKIVSLIVSTIESGSIKEKKFWKPHIYPFSPTCLIY